MGPSKLRAFVVLALAVGASLAPALAGADTISQALARAYLGNPSLNQSRAATRAADEGVAKALSGYRPRIEGSGSIGVGMNVVRSRRLGNEDRDLVPKQGALTITETLYDGNRTTSRVRNAESLDLGAREALREAEQETLLDGATAYMDVLRDAALDLLARNEIRLLEYELRGVRARFKALEVTATDVAQVASQLAQSRTRFYRAEAALATSVASFRRVIGTPPGRLEAARPVDELTPPSLDGAIGLAFAASPRIAEALHDVDAALSTEQMREGALLPTVELVGKGEHTEQRRLATNHLDSLDAHARIAVPVYQGGAEYAEVRQAKEQVAVERLKAASVRDQVRANVAASWGLLTSAKALIFSSKAAVKASEVALVEVREEASLGQRTTKDVLLAIQTLFAARTMLVGAQHDRVVTSYAMAAATGRLDATALGLAVEPYDPTIHYAQVRDKWAGLRTPDGR